MALSEEDLKFNENLGYAKGSQFQEGLVPAPGYAQESVEFYEKKAADLEEKRQAVIAQIRTELETATSGVTEIQPGVFAGQSGATSRSIALDYGLCPKELQEAGISRFEHGIKKGHERNNWRKGKDDGPYQYNRLMHTQKHLAKVIDGSGDWGDVQAVICNLAMLCWWRVNGKGFAEAFPWLLK